MFGGYAAYHLGNYALAVLMYMMLARLLLSFFFAEESRQVIWVATRQLTQPFIAAVRVITPGFVIPKALPFIAIFWLALARLLFWILMADAGLAPSLSSIAPAAG